MRRAGAGSVVLGLLLLAFAFAACQKEHANDSKLMPKTPPPAEVAVPAGTSIAVEIDGAPVSPIDAARLKAVKPDFEDEERRAWKIIPLVGPAADRDGVVLAATGGGGVTVQLPRPKTATDPQPVLMLTRRGEWIAALVKPDDPFPAYHGQGRRLGRPGDPLPRVEGVTIVSVRVP